MARPKHEKATIIKVDIMKMISRIIGMSDNDLAKWTRKALQDLTEGCISDDVDEFVKECYEKSTEAMQNRQKTNAQYYKTHKSNNSTTKNDQETNGISTNKQAGNPPTRESETRGPQTDKFNGDAAIREGAEAVTCRESGVVGLTTASNISQDASNGNADDERRSGSNSVATVNLEHPAPIAESARCATSEAVKALADGDTREDSLNVQHGGNAVALESATSAKNLALDTRTGGDSMRGCDSKPASHSGKSPVRTLSLMPAPQKKAYGSGKHVLLTDEEGKHLRELYGEDLAVAIDILDAYIENNGKAAKRYRNHAAVMRKGNWVYNKLLEMKDREQRLNNSKQHGDHRTFAQKDRDDRSAWLHHSIFANEAVNG